MGVFVGIIVGVGVFVGFNVGVGVGVKAAVGVAVGVIEIVGVGALVGVGEIGTTLVVSKLIDRPIKMIKRMIAIVSSNFFTTEMYSLAKQMSNRAVI